MKTTLKHFTQNRIRIFLEFSKQILIMNVSEQKNYHDWSKIGELIQNLGYKILSDC